MNSEFLFFNSLVRKRIIIQPMLNRADVRICYMQSKDRPIACSKCYKTLLRRDGETHLWRDKFGERGRDASVESQESLLR